MEGDASSSPSLKTIETPTSTKSVSKSRYSSCLSSFRNNYKPPTSSSSKPSNVSSPLLVVEKNTSESVASPSNTAPLLDALIPPPFSPSISSPSSLRDTSYIDIPAPSPFKDQVGTPSLGNHLPLTGMGGSWQGPNSSDMTPDSRNRPQFRQGSGFRNSRGGRDSHLGSFNSSTPNHSFGRNNYSGNTSINSSQGGFSPYNSPGRNLSNNRGNKRGFHSNTPSVDISSYYSPAMTQDPWAELVNMKKQHRENPNTSQNTVKVFQ